METQNKFVKETKVVDQEAIIVKVTHEVVLVAVREAVKLVVPMEDK